MMAYLFELLLYTTIVQFVKLDGEIFGIFEWDVIFALHMAGSLIVMLLWNPKFKPLIYISSVICLAGLVPCLILPFSNIQIVFAAIALFGLGGVVTCSRCGFAFATNNSEKAIGLVAMFVVDRLIRILRNLGYRGTFLTIILPIMLCICLITCLMLYKEEDLQVLERSSKSDVKGLYWALAYFIFFFVVDGELAVFVKGSGFFGVGVAGTYIGITVLALLLFVFKLNSFHVWNVFFVVTALAFLTVAMQPFFNIGAVYYLSAGMTQMGWPLALYFLACAQKRFASYKLLKQSTVIYIIASPISKYGTSIIAHFSPDMTTYNFASAFYIILIMVIFLTLQPYSYRYLFSSEWLSQMSRPDMEAITETVEEKDQFEKWNLSPRQKEVAVLLLSGKTRRQISGELQLSESTVKLHTSELYKKLNINSRIELFSMFGVQGEAGDDSAEEQTELNG